MLEDTTGVIRNRKSRKDRQCYTQKKKKQKDKQWSRKHYTEDYKLNSTDPLYPG